MSGAHRDSVELSTARRAWQTIRTALVRAGHDADRVRRRVHGDLDHMRLLRHRSQHQMLVALVRPQLHAAAHRLLLTIVANSRQLRVQWAPRLLVLGRDLVRDRLGLCESVSGLSEHALCAMGMRECLLRFVVVLVLRRTTAATTDGQHGQLVDVLHIDRIRRTHARHQSHHYSSKQTAEFYSACSVLRRRRGIFLIF